MVKSKTTAKEMEELLKKAVIYTDWANHYLEKARSKRHIVDLQNDVADGVLLAEVIEAVTGEKIKDIKPKPKNSAQMVENINTSLTFLAGLGVSVDGVSAKDIKDGNLKSILGLFFSLSRYKQQQKTLQQQQKQQQQKHHQQQQQQQQQQQHRLSGEQHQQSQQQQQPQQQRVQGSSLSSSSSSAAAPPAGDSNISGSHGGVGPAGGKGLANGGENMSRIPSPFKQGTRGSGIALVSSSSSSSSAAATSSASKDNNASLTSSSSSGQLISRSNSGRSSLPTGSTERGRLHQNQQPPVGVNSGSTNNSSNNNNSSGGGGGSGSGSNGSNNNSNQNSAPGSTSLIPLRASNPNAGGSARATSPAVPQSGIPTPLGRGLPNSRSQTLADKQSNRTSAGSTSSTSSSKSTTSSKPPSSSKNSMLDKFKFFKDKDKDKDKEKEKNKGVVKSASKNSSTSTSTTSTSSRSDTDSRTSSSDTTKSSSFTSSQSSSSGDHAGPSSAGATGGAAVASSNPTTPSKSASKSGKKSLVKAFSSKKDVPEEQGRSGVPPPIPSAVGLGPPTGGPYVNTPSSSSSQRNASPSQGRKSGAKSDRGDPRQGDPRQADPRLAAASPTPSSSKKASKLGSLSGIPKTQPSSSSSSSGKSSKATSSGASASIPTSSSSSSIPTSSSGIPKPSSSKSSGKQSKEDKARAAASSKEYSKALYKESSSASSSKGGSGSSSKSSSSSQHHQQQQLQQQGYPQSAQQQQQMYEQQQHAHHMRQQQQHYSQQAAYSHHQQQQQQQQYQGYPQHYPSHHGAQQMTGHPYSMPHGYIPPYAHNPGYATPTRVPTSPLVQNVHPRVNLQSMERQQQLQQHQQQASEQASAFAPPQQRSAGQASHYVPVTIPAVNMDTHPSNLSQSGRSVKQMLPQSPMMSPNLGRHNPSVNVVKPTMSSSTPTTSSQKSNKSDSNTQTNLSVLHRSATPKHITASSESGKSSSKSDETSAQSAAKQDAKTMTSMSSPSMAKKSSSKKSGTPDRALDSPELSKEGMTKCSTPDKDLDTTCKETVSGDAGEQPEMDTAVTGMAKLSMKDTSSAAMEKTLTPSNINSPKLGVKMLGSHISKNASNVAVVQPRSGEKMETTFDAEVRTETIHKMSPDSDITKPAPGKETTFLTPDKEEKTTFLDDAGEAMDIKPMPPIMRALPYGYFRGYSGYGGFNNRNFHIPAISVPTTAMYASRTTSAQGLGMPRPLIDHSPGKFCSGQIKRANSSTCPNSASSDADYASESDTYDYVSGYMSDGDILKNNRNNGGGGGDDWTSGYLSEGGASLYARRLQQRFREGMQAVRECMQKSSGIIDDDSFDDSSSISSGEISDTIAEISTDENLTGSSQGALSDNPYNSLKRAPKDILAIHGGYNNGGPGGHPGMPYGHPSVMGKRVPNLGTSAFMGTDYNSDSGVGSPWGRKYSLPQTGKFLSNDPNKLLSSDPSDYGYGYGWPSSRSDGGYSSLRKMSCGSNPDYAYHSEGDYDSPHRSFSPGPGMKKDIETNTDQSHLLEASMRRLQTGRSGNSTPPSSNGAGTQFGYRRPLSNASNSSGGSNKSSGSKGQGSSAVGSRLAKHGVDNGQRSIADPLMPRPASASGKPMNPDVAMMEGYNSSTLDRKRKNGGLTSSKSTGSTQTEREYQSNSLGRRRLFGSKNSLSKSPQGEQGGSGTQLVGGTIISNPHATYGRDKQTSHYVNLQELHARIPGSNYVPLEFASSPRNSGLGSPAVGPGSMWLKSSASSNGVGLPPPIPSHSPHPFHAHAMSDSETFESLANPQIQAQIQQARALTNARMLAHHADMVPPPLPCSSSSNQCLQRSNSIKSDSAYCSTKHSSFNEELPRTGSFSQLVSSQQSHTVPASPTLSQSSRFTYPMAYGPSPTPMGLASAPIMVRSSTQSSLPYSHAGGLGKRASRDEDDSRLCKSSTLDYSFVSDYAYLSSVHGSTLSLVSSSSSVYSSAEDKHAHEVRKLKRDLIIAQEKVQTLTNQLSTNAHVVSAFEQSLSSMTARLQSLTSNAEHKASLPDTELNELRMTIEALKRQSKMTLQDPVISPSVTRRHTSPGMKDIHITAGDSRIARQMSSDSVSSINSLSSACSMTSQQSAHTDSEATKRMAKQNKKKGWLRSSFSKAFSRKKGKTGSLSDVEPDSHSLRSNASAPNSPLLQLGHMGAPSMKGSHSSGALCDNDVNALKQALRDKDMKLTDIRLEALSSAHQLEQLREAMTKMKNEMSALKADNDRLHKMMSTSQSSRTLNLSHGAMSPHHTRTSTDSLDRSFSMTEHSSLDMLLAETAANERDGKRVTIAVVLGSNPDPSRSGIDKPAEVFIGTLSVSGKTKWDILDNVIRKIFKEYVLRVDPVTNLGLSAESVFSYVVGEVVRTKDSELPELLPIGYLVGDTMQIEICLKGTKQSCVDSLAFETMIPKTIIQRYVSLLLEHRRIILCGPSGTGKTYLAQKLAEHVVLRSGRELTAGSVATFNVDHKSAKELRQYLANIADQCENTNVHALPSAIILDNLHHVTSLADVFNGFLSVKYQKCPYIIGTMSQSSCSTTNLQLHHNFRFVLCANHMEVKGFLGRFLRRKLVEAEIRTGLRNNDLNRVVDWIPKVWAHLNKALESHSSADVTIGPRLFMSCPMDIGGSQVWFTDLWNYTLVETVREGLQVYGCRSAWEDPTDWVLETYPWPNRGSGTSLMHIRADDLGYEPQAPNSPSSVIAKTKSPVIETKDADPLANMLMRLQEAAGTYNANNSHSGPHSNNDSDSIDSHNSIQDFSSSSGVESRL